MTTAATWLIAACTPEAVDPPGGDPGPWTPNVVVTDLAPAAGFQDYTSAGAFQRGRSCAIRDLNNDGRLDVMVGNPADLSYTLRNVGTPGNLAFTPAGPYVEGALIWGILPADYDEDGDDDLFLSTGGIEGPGYDQFLRNDNAAAGIFTDVAAEVGVLGGQSPLSGEPMPAMSVGAQWVDFDADGDLDLHVETGVYPSLWDDVPPDTAVARNNLWRNDGGLFTDVADEAGLTIQGNGRFSSWLDYDQDGDLDLYQNHFATTPNILWSNRLVETGAATFEDVTLAASLNAATDLRYPLETFATGTTDFNNDGWPDIILYVRGLPNIGPYGEGHVMLINVEGRGFVSVGDLANVDIGPPVSALRDHTDFGVMGNQLHDLNGDGLPDLVIGNGGPTAGNSDQLLLSRGLEAFEVEGAGLVNVPVYDDWSHLTDFPAAVSEAPAEAYPPYPYRTHAVCAGDLDRDGAVDVAVLNGGMFLIGGDSSREPNRLFRFETDPPASHLRLRLRGNGVDLPTDATGSTATVHAIDGEGEPFDVVRTYWSRDGFGAHGGPELFFGLRDAAGPVDVTVRWTDGRTTLHPGVELGTTVELEAP